MLRLLMTAIALIGTTLAFADTALNLDEEFLVITHTNTDHLERDIKKAADAGYRLVSGSASGGDKAAVIMRAEDRGANLHKYQVVVESDVQDLESELKTWGERGYRLIPNTVMVKSRMLDKARYFTLVEKAGGPVQTYEYLLVDTGLNSGLQALLKDAESRGFGVVSMITRGEGQIVILEKAL